MKKWYSFFAGRGGGAAGDGGLGMWQVRIGLNGCLFSISQTVLSTAFKTAQCVHSRAHTTCKIKNCECAILRGKVVLVSL